MKLQHCFMALLATALVGTADAAERAVTTTFSRQEIDIITSYYHDAPKPASKPVRLPRGIAKNLARGKTLPPGIAKQQLPVELVRRLPSPPTGYERIVVAGKILLVEVATQVVHDVLTDVLFR